MYGLLISGKPVAAPTRITFNDNVIFNPTDEQYIAAGYKPIVYSVKPESDDDIPVYYAEVWTENSSRIEQSWAECDSPAEELPLPSLEERVSAIEGAIMELAEVFAHG